jgi:hypothetical protein
MIIYDQLRISDDGRRMYINLHVNNADYFKDIYLDSITIMTQDQVSEAAPEMVTDDYIYKYIFDGEQKQADMVLTPNDFNEHFAKGNFSSDLFFVYIKVKGTPDECTPCRLDEETTLGVTFDENILYQRVMGFTKELLKECSINQGFLNFILQWNAFKAAIDTEHYIPAIQLWNRLFKEGAHVMGHTKTKGCGCHG